MLEPLPVYYVFHGTSLRYGTCTEVSYAFVVEREKAYVHNIESSLDTYTSLQLVCRPYFPPYTFDVCNTCHSLRRPGEQYSTFSFLLLHTVDC